MDSLKELVRPLKFQKKVDVEDIKDTKILKKEN